jgi:hypothetical protein
MQKELSHLAYLFPLKSWTLEPSHLLSSSTLTAIPSSSIRNPIER